LANKLRRQGLIGGRRIKNNGLGMFKLNFSGSPSVSFSAPDGSFLAQASDFSSGADLGSTAHTVSVVVGPGSLTLWVTETGINLGPTPEKLAFLSVLTQNELPGGATVTETTYFDANDTAYGIGTKLATHTFTAEDTNNPGVTTTLNVFKPYSITEQYQVTIALASPPTALSTISLDTTTLGRIPVTPEPSTWAMMAIGFAGLGYAAFSRSRKLGPRRQSPDRRALVSLKGRPWGGLFVRKRDCSAGRRRGRSSGWTPPRLGPRLRAADLRHGGDGGAQDHARRRLEWLFWPLDEVASGAMRER
jgi:hypothetical protein